MAEPSPPNETAAVRAGLGRTAWPLIGIVAIAFVVRLVYLYQVETLPFFYHPIGDARSYWDWSGRIAAGDWLGSEVFYQAPAYPYFLGLVRGIVGDDLWRVRLVQIILGAISCGLLALASRWLISPAAGWWTGGLTALYGPAIFYDGLIQKAGLSFFLIAAILCLLGWMSALPVRRRMRIAVGLVVGVLLGGLAITTEQSLLLIGVVLTWMLIARTRAGGPPAISRRSLEPGGALALLVACGVVLGAVAWRNHRVGGVWAVTTVQAGPNFYIGNHAAATGRYVALIPGHETPEFERRDAVILAEAGTGRTLTAKEVSRYWFGRACTWIRAHPADWLRLMGYKVLLVWNAYEIPDAESYTLYREFSWALGVLGRMLHFGVLCPLAIVGVIRTAGEWRRLWPLYTMITVLACGVAGFYVFGRYRYPLVPFIAIFAGAGASELYTAIRSWTRPSVLSQSAPRPHAVVLLVVCGLGAVATNLNVNPEDELDALAYANLGAVLGQQGNYGAAVYFLERATQGAPDSVDARFNLGMAYRLSGDRERALQEFKRVLAMHPERIEVDFQLGALYEEAGQTEEAIVHFRRALEIDPQDTEARERLERLTRK